MQISVPQVGSLTFMAKDFIARIGHCFVEAPTYSDRTVRLGVSVAPETFCFPMKVLLGSSIEALEKGADTLVAIAGFGPCRFSYFAELQRRILRRMGYDFNMVVFDSPRDSVGEFYRSLKILKKESSTNIRGLIREMPLALRKGWLYDEIEKRAMATRGIEAKEGSTDKAAQDALSVLKQVRNKKDTKTAGREIGDIFRDVSIEPEHPHIRIGLVGELLTVLEPYFNFDAARWLAKNGVVLERSVHISDVFTPMGRNPVFGFTDEEILSAAKPYLGHEIGGHGLLSTGAAVMFARQGFDAVIHFHPFTCMPEVIARTIFVRISDELDMPIVSLSIDEQTGMAGLQTRLEALLELIWARKRKYGTNPSRQSA